MVGREKCWGIGVLNKHPSRTIRTPLKLAKSGHISWAKGGVPGTVNGTVAGLTAGLLNTSYLDQIGSTTFMTIFRGQEDSYLG